MCKIYAILIINRAPASICGCSNMAGASVETHTYICILQELAYDSGTQNNRNKKATIRWQKKIEMYFFENAIEMSR